MKSLIILSMSIIVQLYFSVIVVKGYALRGNSGMEIEKVLKGSYEVNFWSAYSLNFNVGLQLIISFHVPASVMCKRRCSSMEYCVVSSIEEHEGVCYQYKDIAPVNYHDTISHEYWESVTKHHDVKSLGPCS